jgi:hypothetical protein
MLGASESAAEYLWRNRGRIDPVARAARDARRDGRRDVAREIIRLARSHRDARNRLGYHRLIRRRVELNSTIRCETLTRNSYPNLAPQKWAAWWRRQFTHQHDRAIRCAKRELKEIEKQIGPAPQFWKPREARGLERMRQQYRDTETLPFEFFVAVPVAGRRRAA